MLRRNFNGSAIRIMPGRNSISRKFCRCVKKVAGTVGRRRSTLKAGKGKYGKESTAIAVRVRSVLGSRGRTLRRFSCKKKGGPRVITQEPIAGFA